LEFFKESDLRDFRDCALVREDRILGNAHVEAAERYALENFRNGRMISKTIWNEILLYLSLQRQVKRAFEIIGVKNYSGRVIKIGYLGSSTVLPEISITDSKKTYWGVTTPEEILEKMALFHLENF
jgi:tRNA threonylcarbamoyladenosine modification (KEOPS) complex Cgi121 subunit